MKPVPVADKIIILGTGILYGFGFALAGFADPATVQTFLDLTLLSSGEWNVAPAIALALALFVAMIGIRLGQRMKHPVFGTSFEMPNGGGIDGRLFVGALFFGLGWGFSGFVPVTAFAALFILPYDAALFLIGVAIGFVIADFGVTRDGHAPKGA